MTTETEYASDGIRLPRAVWVLVGARVVNRIGGFTLAFLAVVLVDELGASLAQAGAVVAAFGLATIPSRLVGGVLADRIGRVPTICVGLAGCAVGQLWVAASSSWQAASVGVIVLGLAFEIYEPPSQALVADLTDDAQRPRAFGLLGAALAVGGALAGLLAAWLGGLDLRLLLVADAVSCLLAAVVVATLVRGVARAPRSSGGLRMSWRDPRLLAVTAAGSVFALVYMSLVIGLPLTLAARGLSPERAGLLLALSAVTLMAGQPLLRLRVLRLRVLQGHFRALAIGYVVLAVGLAGTGLATSLAGFALAALVWSVADLLLMSNAWSVVVLLAPPSARGAYLATYGLSWGIGTVGAPLLCTLALDRAGPEMLWLGLGAASLGLAVAQPALARLCVALPPHPSRPTLR